MTDEQKAERRKVITNNKAWETATPVRREYVTELVARRSVPKGTLRYVTEVIMADPAGLAAGDGDRVASLIGKETHPGAWDRTAAMALASDASDARLPLVLLAQVAASVEARFGERQGWRHPTRPSWPTSDSSPPAATDSPRSNRRWQTPGRDRKATNRAPRSALATAPAQPGLLRVATQFRSPHAASTPDTSPPKSTQPEL